MENNDQVLCCNLTYGFDMLVFIRGYIYSVFTYMFCLVISACMFTLFKRPSKVSTLARVALAEVGCYIWYQSIRFTRIGAKRGLKLLLKAIFKTN